MLLQHRHVGEGKLSSLYSLENIVFALEIIGTIAFAISGATLGLEKGMDLMGITILGLTTGVGGGIIRDIIIGQTPSSNL